MPGMGQLETTEVLAVPVFTGASPTNITEQEGVAEANGCAAKRKSLVELVGTVEVGPVPASTLEV